jgi:hypothetical protein
MSDVIDTPEETVVPVKNTKLSQSEDRIPKFEREPEAEPAKSAGMSSIDKQKLPAKDR